MRLSLRVAGEPTELEEDLSTYGHKKFSLKKVLPEGDYMLNSLLVLGNGKKETNMGVFGSQDPGHP